MLNLAWCFDKYESKNMSGNRKIVFSKIPDVNPLRSSKLITPRFQIRGQGVNFDLHTVCHFLLISSSSTDIRTESCFVNDQSIQTNNITQTARNKTK